MTALIPPLLIENFVENAIKYALNPKDPIDNDLLAFGKYQDVEIVTVADFFLRIRKA